MKCTIISCVKYKLLIRTRIRENKKKKKEKIERENTKKDDGAERNEASLRYTKWRRGKKKNELESSISFYVMKIKSVSRFLATTRKSYYRNKIIIFGKRISTKLNENRKAWMADEERIWMEEFFSYYFFFFSSSFNRVTPLNLRCLCFENVNSVSGAEFSVTRMR